MKKPISSSAIIIVTILVAATSHPLLVTSLGSASTISVSYGHNSTTVCGIIAGNSTQRIQCYKDGNTIFIEPNFSYESISGGRDLFCGLRSGGLSFFCWDTATFLAKRLYHSDANRLTGLTVGNSRVCAVQVANGVALCWRFPLPKPLWKFVTITSGGGFFCGILKNNSRVVCWGDSEIGAEIQSQFGNLTMLSLVAGKSHACGVSGNGNLICKGSNASGQLDVPSHSPFEFSGLALGSNHSCGIRRINGFVDCWGGRSKNGLSEFASDELRFVSFEIVESGLDFTCGLTTKNLSVICWGPGWSGGLSSGTVLPLAMVLPGPCHLQASSCSVCGEFPNSDNLCAGSGTICKSCDVELPIPVLLPPVPPSAPPSRALQPLSPPSEAKNKLLLAFGVVGYVGVCSGICTIVYWLWRKSACGFLINKMGLSDQAGSGRANVGGAAASAANSGKLTENSPTLGSQRSGTSSKHADRAATEIFSLPELAAATNNFSSENKIGGGSFGTVYKGKLADGRQVAIKRGEIGARTNKTQEKESAFDSELALLSRLHHKHLVELVGFCQEGDEMLIVYEHMSNGSLHDHLHNKNNVEKMSSILNSWEMRIKIALDAARGIEYLHNYAMPPIIHRDIKSSNILLDGNWTAKVSDFGLSLMDQEPNQALDPKVVGTVGYIDPEYYILNVSTVKSDVYGLGVVLLELLTGKRAVFKDEDSNPVGVVEYAGPRIAAGQLWSVLDKRVEMPAVNEVEAVELVAYTAVHCVSLEGKERPSITEIVVNLERALDLCDGSLSSTT
ncbi:non-specific serine,threonine protein kinase [Sarracenia purpurea var. burkii]